MDVFTKAHELTTKLTGMRIDNDRDYRSSRSRLKASSSAPPVQRSSPSGGDSLGSAPLTQSSDAEALGVVRRPT